MKKAFSLIELLIVLLIMGLLAGLVLPNLIGKGEEAKNKVTCIQMKSVANGLDMFKMDNGSFPTTAEGLKALLSNPSKEKYPKYPSKPYMKKLPQDPWGHNYIYINMNNKFDIISLGADGKESEDDIKHSTCEK